MFTFDLNRLFHRFELYTHLWERVDQLKHTPNHFKMPLNWERRVDLQKDSVLALPTVCCSVPGHYSFGMLVYL